MRDDCLLGRDFLFGKVEERRGRERGRLIFCWIDKVVEDDGVKNCWDGYIGLWLGRMRRDRWFKVICDLNVGYNNELLKSLIRRNKIY